MVSRSSSCPVAVLDALEQLVEERGALAALRALAAGLVTEEARDDHRGAHRAGRVVHDDDAAGAEQRAGLLQRVVIHAHADAARR